MQDENTNETEHKILSSARQFFEESLAIEQIFKRLPAGTQIKVVLDGGFEGHLFHDGSATRFSPEPSKIADFELKLSSEALRRLSKNPPTSLGDLSSQLIKGSINRDINWRLLVPAKSLVNKGYGQSLKDLGPLIQGEAVQALMIHAGQAVQKFEELKAKFKNKN
jgi:hypothetical protein